MPRSGEDMATAEIVIPAVDELLTARGGSFDDRVEHLRFEGLTFEYAGWLRPNVTRSHHSNQNNMLRDDGHDGNQRVRRERLPEAAVTVDKAQNVAVVDSEFRRLGSTGLLMQGGIQHAEVVGNTVLGTYDRARADFAALEDAGVNLTEVFGLLEEEGVTKFIDSWESLLAGLSAKLKSAA
jgi:hypothetical protein